MRIVWKDSREWRSYIYREYKVEHIPEGWITNLPGDDNIHYTAETAKNYIDKMLGGKTRTANPLRHKFGIKIVGKKDGGQQCG